MLIERHACLYLEKTCLYCVTGGICVQSWDNLVTCNLSYVINITF